MEDKAKRILIVEDDRFISEMYARTLRKGGYTVEESMTGPEGLTKAKQGGWYIILLDIMLPDKTGIEIIQELRESKDTGVSGAKIIIITNFEQDDATRQSLEKLADGYLIKAEITPRRMLEIVREFDNVPTEAQSKVQETVTAEAPQVEDAITVDLAESDKPTESESEPKLEDKTE